MKCSVSELEIETIFSRIMSQDIDLKPDFQRGEVWSISKKRKLIDSILRGWRIPPVHMIENGQYVDEVLDGQQRLATIRDFLANDIRIDGNLSPIDKNILEMDGLVFSQLDNEAKRKFKKYSVTIVRLTEYTAEEPAELFFRLNQPATLTSAEQRNAFIGDTRNQIRNLVEIFEEAGAKKETIGFSNSRMAYDDIISKFCFILEAGTLKKKITSMDISEKYRTNKPFNQSVITRAEEILLFFIESAKKSLNDYNRKLSLNKATLFSWLIFINRHINKLDKEELAELLYEFEHARHIVKGKEKVNLFTNGDYQLDILKEYPFYQSMFLIFNQRASMGSTDATSIIYRDIILELFMTIYFKGKSYNTKFNNYLLNTYKEKQNLSNMIEEISNEFNWGAEIS